MTEEMKGNVGKLIDAPAVNGGHPRLRGHTGDRHNNIHASSGMVDSSEGLLS